MTSDALLSQPEVPTRRRLPWVRLMLVFVLVGLVILVWWWSRQKAVGTTAVQPAPQQEGTPAGQLERYEGTWARFSYSAAYEHRGQEESVAFPLLERAIFARGDVEGRKLVFLVQDITSLSLEEYPGYRARTLDKEAYQKHQSTVNGKQVTFFLKDTTVFEAGAFWQEGSRAYSLVVSSPIRSTGLREELESIVESLEP